MNLGAVGVWHSGPFGPEDPAELEELGYGTFWTSGGFEPGFAPHFEQLLNATNRMKVASGIISIWASDPDDIAASVAALAPQQRERFMLGLGVSHALLVPAYERPYAALNGYLDALDAHPTPVASQRRLLGALGPRMLELARERTLGAHPYLVPVEHTVVAREALGPDAMLAPELTVVLERDPIVAREIARPFAARYLYAENYSNNLRRLGFGDADLSGAGSDRLLDALVAFGDAETIAKRVREHHDAGADHVCIQVLNVDPAGALPMAELRELAPALIS